MVDSRPPGVHGSSVHSSLRYLHKGATSTGEGGGEICTGYLTFCECRTAALPQPISVPPPHFPTTSHGVFKAGITSDLEKMTLASLESRVTIMQVWLALVYAAAPQHICASHAITSHSLAVRASVLACLQRFWRFALFRLHLHRSRPGRRAWIQAEALRQAAVCIQRIARGRLGRVKAYRRAAKVSPWCASCCRNRHCRKLPV